MCTKLFKNKSLGHERKLPEFHYFFLSQFFLLFFSELLCVSSFKQMVIVVGYDFVCGRTNLQVTGLLQLQELNGKKW